MIVVPAGDFLMGSSEAETQREARAPAQAASERPQHREALPRPPAIGRYLITVAQFDRFVRATGRDMAKGCTVDDGGIWLFEPRRSYRDPAFPQTRAHPAVCVTWDDAKAYAAWLSTATGHAYRLLHETEFEYAARGGTTTARWWGDSPDGLCRYANGADRSFYRAFPGDPKVNRACDDGYAGTSPVGHYRPNPFGLYDMLGDAWEWTADCFREDYTLAAEPPPDGECSRRAIRGGSWHNYPNVLRAANRFWLSPDNRSSSIGFRLARDPDDGGSARRSGAGDGAAYR